MGGEEGPLRVSTGETRTRVARGDRPATPIPCPVNARSFFFIVVRISNERQSEWSGQPRLAVPTDRPSERRSRSFARPFPINYLASLAHQNHCGSAEREGRTDRHSAAAGRWPRWPSGVNYNLS